MGTHEISTPRGKITVSEGGKAQLEWNPGFGEKYSKAFDKKQEYVDSEVLRYCSPLVPLQTGMLEKSGILGTEIGSGMVEYIAPYAHHQYHDTEDSRPYDGSRGAHWFERMKAAHKGDILNGAKKV